MVNVHKIVKKNNKYGSLEDMDIHRDKSMYSRKLKIRVF